jgi:hypothetical protein
LKYIAGYSISPYNLLNDTLHLEMCNFRQSSYCMDGGARVAAFLPRAYYKSTIFTHGADSWEGLRNPDIAINIRNAIMENGQDFLRNIRGVYDSNLLVEALYPAHYVVNPKNQPRWNESELLLPNRTMRQVEATFSIGGMTGAGEGKHFDVLNVDDPVGLDDLNEENAGNMNMTSKMRWCRTNFRALLRSKYKSRIVLVQTRFSMDDPSSIPIANCKEVFGYALEEFEEMPSGEWVIYNRVPIENGKLIFPEIVSEQELENAMNDDAWSASTQLFNRPRKAGMAEFGDMLPKKAKFIYDSEKNTGFIVRGGMDNYDDMQTRVALQDLDIVMSVDPAGTDRGISSKTCKTAIVVWAVDAQENYYLLKSRSGFFNVTTWFNLIFQLHETSELKGRIREVIVESNAMQSILKPLLDREKLARDIYINFQPVPAKGDKDARIRTNVGRILQNGHCYICEGEGLDLISEIKYFPQLRFKKDVLDASEKAITRLQKPITTEETEEMNEREEMFVSGRSSVTGY